MFGKGGSTIAEVKAKAGVTIRTEVRCEVKERPTSRNLLIKN